VIALAKAPQCAGGKVTLAERANFTIQIEPDAERPRRLRWTILENGKHRDRSTYSYATKHEALRDAEKFLEKLNETWRGKP
jgi:hypothetical protein